MPCQALKRPDNWALAKYGTSKEKMRLKALFWEDAKR